MFVGSCNGFFRRLDAKTGAVRWETNVRDKAAAKYFFHGDVFVAPDRIIASADVETGTGAEAGLHAFDRNSGRQLWKHSAGRGIPGAVIGSDDRVFLYAHGDLIALDLHSGKKVWSVALKADGWESPAVVGRRVFAGSGDGSVYAFNADTGRIVWQRKVGSPISTSVRVSESDVYAGTTDGMVHRLAGATGEALASLKLDPTLKPSSAPVVTSNAVFVLLTDKGVNYRVLVSLDPALNRINWRRDAPDRWTTTRVFGTKSTIILGTPSGEVTAYCSRDGSPAWSHKVSAAPIRSIGGSEQILYVGTPAGTLFAIRPPALCE